MSVRPSKQSSTQSRKQNAGGVRRGMPRVLIVDDDVDAANALASLLQSSGYGDARVAYTGATALALVVEFVPTVLLVDLDLPDMSGYDVARQLSQRSEERRVGKECRYGWWRDDSKQKKWRE